MMTTNVISLEEALSHLEKNISNASNCKKQVVDLVRWIINWNSDRSLNNQVFSFVREVINIAFALDRNNNRLLDKSKPNFLVFKINSTGNVDADFDLGRSGYPLLSQYLNQRKNNPPRWVVSCKKTSEMSFSDFQKLFLIAYERKGGVL